MIFTAAFWKGAAERAVKTFAQALLAVIGVTGLGFADIDWVAQFSVAGLAALASLLTSIVNPSFTSGVDAELVEAEAVSEANDALEAPDPEPYGKHAAE